MSNTISLWQINQTILGLMELSENPEATEEERAVAMQELEQWVIANVREVDPVAEYISTGEAIADAAERKEKIYHEHAVTWRRRVAGLKALCVRALNYIGEKRIVSATGNVIRRQINGGLQRLEINDEGLIPDECVEFKLTLSFAQYGALNNILSKYPGIESSAILALLRLSHRIVDEARVREFIRLYGYCPGAELKERGEHLRVS